MPSRRKKPDSQEYLHQCDFIKWCRLFKGPDCQYPDLDLIYATPNGAHVTEHQRRKLGREGMRKGVLDLCLPVPRGKFHGMYIEFKFIGKRNKAGNIIPSSVGTLTDEQIDFKSRVTRLGYHTIVAYTWHAAQDAVKEYYAPN